MEEINGQIYERDARNIILGLSDKRGDIWDVFGEVAADVQVGKYIYKSMLETVHGGNTKKPEQIDRAVELLVKISTAIVKKVEERKITYWEIYKEIFFQFAKTLENEDSDTTDTVTPVLSVLFRMYYIGVKDNRCFVDVDDLMDAQSVVLVDPPSFPNKLNMVNNALMGVTSMISSPSQLPPVRFEKGKVHSMVARTAPDITDFVLKKGELS